MTTLRVLGAVRQSKTRDKSISPTTQKTKIKAWASANDARVVKITEDLSRSGSVSAFKRPELGPWLTDPQRVAAWDVLVTLRLDRACRDAADYFTLRKWAKEHGKRVVFLNNPELDESTPGGKALAGVQAIFAEFERDMICERNKERYATMVELGKFPGGRVPFGWRLDSGILVSDEGGNADVLRQMADMSIAGKSNGQIAQWLNANSYLNGWKKPWETERVRIVLHADATAKLLGEAKSAELRAALRGRSQNHGERIGAHMLLRVAYCRTDGEPLYAMVEKKRPEQGRYRCLKCRTRVPKDALEQFVEAALLDAAGEREATKLQLVPGDDHQTAIHALEREIETLSGISGTEAVIAAKQAEIDALRDLPYEPDHYEPVKLGMTIAQYWPTLDEEGKGSFLRHWGVTVKADKLGAELRTGWLAVDSDTFPL